MSQKERKRLAIMSRVKEGEMTIREGSEVLGISYRQACRIHRRYLEGGDEGLIHRSRGRPSNRGKPPEVKEAVLSLYQERYWDFGPTLAAEKLLERDGYQVGHETLRRWLLGAGLWERHRKRPKHRNRRERKAHFGELVQMDGSHHRWFEGCEEKGCLMDMVDDATGITLALMRQEETTEAAMEVLWAWIEKYGIPRALYTDRKTVYITDREPSLEEQLAGEEPLTQFGRACRKLGIEIVPASSPQAKGRVERKHGVYQDRLVKELRLAGIQDVPSANAFLAVYVETLNGKFALEPSSPADFHQPVPDGLDLRDVFCLEETRVISNDWVVRYKNRFLQIVPQSNPPLARNKVTVQEHLDGSIHIMYRDRKVIFTEINERAAPLRPTPETITPQLRKAYVPSQDHPWRRFNPMYLGKGKTALV